MDLTLQTIDDYLTEKVKVIQEIPKKSLLNACNLVIEAKTNRKKIFTLGNGGSANTASHLITDWNKSGSAREKIDFMVFAFVTILVCSLRMQMIAITQKFF